MLDLKKERDQVGYIIERHQREWSRAQDEAERDQLNELATARHAMATAGAR